ncbi:Alpha/Beta hydrolase protein [Apiospora sp. TS-2023a]
MAINVGYVHEDAFDEGFLQVDQIHNLHYEQYGPKDGKPVIFLHGGPGAGTSKANTAFFDPAVYRVVLLDQRGAGKSTPCAELRENTTQHLVADIERLREHLGIPKWHMVFGGSWGSTLSLAYAQTHPDMVGSLVLRGIFLGSRVEGQWAEQAMAAFYPDKQRQFLEYLPAELRANPDRGFYKLACTGDDRAARVDAARAWNRREMDMSSLKADPAALARLDDENWVMSHACLELHYFVHDCFLKPLQFIEPDNIAKIAHIPTSLVQGRLDLLCPPTYAWKLHEALPQSKLYIIDGAGHSAMEPDTFKQLKAVCDEYAKL